MASGRPSVLRELARAKVNLTLEIKGKRADGYHELESLVLFADFGDQLTYAPGEEGFGLEVDGPFAGACFQFASSNLVKTAAEAFGVFAGRPPRGGFHLTKNIPIAAGLGGGSADAAATLRLLAAEDGTAPRCSSDRGEQAPAPRCSSDRGEQAPAPRCSSDRLAPASRCDQTSIAAPAPGLAALIPVARKIGADVPVCLHSRATLMTGIGEKLHPLGAIEPIPAVLVNPKLPLATRDVFRELGAKPLTAAADPPSLPGFAGRDQTSIAAEFRGFADVLAYALARGNDLEPPARRLLPCVGEILDTLASARGAALARLSGSGPTCYALFREQADADAAAEAIRHEHPGWWVQATRLS